jgi:oligopeptide/dipeptide ABC transporter ATP-binding protein
MNTSNLLSVVQLKKHFPLGKAGLFSRNRPVLHAVENVSFQVKEGETFAIVGESGCGKSTLGRTVLQLLRPTSGDVFYCANGEEINLSKLTEKELLPYRKQLQTVFQDPYSSLNPRMSVGRSIAEGPLAHGVFRRGKMLDEYVLSVMNDCGLSPQFFNRYPHEFSGGQRQRVCIARALALKPKFIVCDECVSALDVSVQSQILNLLQTLKEKEKLTYLFISHDLAVVRHVADRIAVMYLGEIVETGDSERVFQDPRHPYTLALTSASPDPHRTKKGEGILLEGQLPSAVNPPKGCKFHTRCFMAKKECKEQEIPLFEVEKGRFVRCLFAKQTAKEKRAIAHAIEKNG